MDFESRLLRWLSAIGGFFVAVVLGALAHAFFGPELVAKAIGSLKEWQTLLAGLVAFAVGFFTILMLSHQIRQVRKIEENRSYRKLTTARAVLPLALSGLIRHSDQCLSPLKCYHENVEGSKFRPPDGWSAPTFPRVPETDIAEIQTCYEFVEAENIKALAWFMAQIQIIDSRLAGLAKNSNSTAKNLNIGVKFLDEYLVDSLEFRLRASKALDYARQEPEKSGRTKIDDTTSVQERSQQLSPFLFLRVGIFG